MYVGKRVMYIASFGISIVMLNLPSVSLSLCVCVCVCVCDECKPAS